MTEEVSIQQGVQVVIRVRPMTSAEQATDPTPIIAPRGQSECVLLEHTKGYREKDVFGYDKCFWSIGPNPATQEDIYAACGAGGVGHALAGYNVCIMAYGQTGSGKTFTMLGPDGGREQVGGQCEGIIPRLAADLFQRRADAMQNNTLTTYKDVTITLACFEIYNENVRDLFGDDRGNTEFAKLRVRQHPMFGPFVDKLSKRDVTDAASCMALLQKAAVYRRTASTKSNDVSSRSHAIFQLRVSQTEALEEIASSQIDSAVTMSMINLVDLAGSERIAKTGATGERLTEATYINLSLTTLRKVIDALVDKVGLVPYRESMLTWLLSESIGGNSLTSVIATVSASSSHFEETQSTLRYALRTKGVVNTAKKNESRTAMLIRQLREEIENLRVQVRSNTVSRQGSFLELPMTARGTESQQRNLTRRQQRMTCPPILTEVQHAILDNLEAVTEIQNMASRCETRAADTILKAENRALKVGSNQWDGIPLGNSVGAKQNTPRSDGQSNSSSGSQDGARQVRFHVNPTPTSMNSPAPVPSPAPLPTPVPAPASIIPQPTPMDTAGPKEVALKKRIAELESQLQFTRSHDDIQDFIRQALQMQRIQHESTIADLKTQIQTLSQRPKVYDNNSQTEENPEPPKNASSLKMKTPRMTRVESILNKSTVAPSPKSGSTANSTIAGPAAGNAPPNAAGEDSQVSYDEFHIDWVLPHLAPTLAQKLREQVHIMSKAICDNNALVVTLSRSLESRDVEVMNLRRDVMELRTTLHELLEEES